MGFLDQIKDSAISFINKFKDDGNPNNNNNNNNNNPNISSTNSGRTRKNSTQNHKTSKNSNNNNDVFSRIPKTTDKDKKKRLTDILRSLQISVGIEVPANIYMQRDIKRVNFDTQRPSGYDTGQVSAFVSSVAKTLGWYEKQLRVRNNNIKDLAEAYDRISLELERLELADTINTSGISTLTVSEIEEIEAESRFLRKQNEELSNTINTMQKDGGASIIQTLEERISELEEQNQELHYNLEHYKKEHAKAQAELHEREDDDSYQGMFFEPGHIERDDNDSDSSRSLDMFSDWADEDYSDGYDDLSGDTWSDSDRDENIDTDHDTDYDDNTSHDNSDDGDDDDDNDDDDGDGFEMPDFSNVDIEYDEQEEEERETKLHNNKKMLYKAGEEARLIEDDLDANKNLDSLI